MKKTSQPCFWLLFAMAAMLVTLGGCGEEKQKNMAAAPTVTYLEVTTQPAAVTSSLPGRLSAYFVAEVRPQVGGIVQKRLFEEGSLVQEGQVLYQIDPALYQADYDNAKASLARAEAAAYTAKLLAQRYSTLVKTNAVSRQDYDDAVAGSKTRDAEVESASAVLETARINLEYTKVTAPVTGIIGKSSVTAGALVTKNQTEPLATIQQLDKMYLDVFQPVFEVMDMRRKFGENADKEIRLVFQDGSEYAHQGKLQFYDVTVSASTDMVNIRIVFNNKNNLLVPNMYARAVITEGVDENAILVPQKAVGANHKGQSIVMVLVPAPKNGDGANAPGLYAVETRLITTSKVLDANRVYVSAGLAPGEKILVEGQMKIKQGTLVTAIPYVEPTPNRPGKPL